MSGSAALASVKRRRSGMEKENVIIEGDAPVERAGRRMQISSIEALSLHEQKMEELFEFHLADKKRIGELEELVKELCEQHNSTVDEMDKFDKTFKEYQNTTQNSLKNLETRVEKVNGVSEVSRIRKKSASIKNEVLLEAVVGGANDNVLPTFPEIEATEKDILDNIIFDENED